MVVLPRPALLLRPRRPPALAFFDFFDEDNNELHRTTGRTAARHEGCMGAGGRWSGWEWGSDGDGLLVGSVDNDACKLMMLPDARSRFSIVQALVC